MREDGAIVLRGEGVSFFVLARLKACLKLEMRGMKVSRGPTAYSQLLRMGFIGTRKVVLEQVEREVERRIKEKKADA